MVFIEYSEVFGNCMLFISCLTWVCKDYEKGPQPRVNDHIACQFYGSFFGRLIRVSLKVSTDHFVRFALNKLTINMKIFY